MKLAWEKYKENRSRQELDVLLVSLYFARQIHSGSVSCSPSISTVTVNMTSAVANPGFS